MNNETFIKQDNGEQTKVQTENGPKRKSGMEIELSDQIKLLRPARV